jgi:soluble lytic murein transglycosylase
MRPYLVRSLAAICGIAVALTARPVTPADATAPGMATGADDGRQAFIAAMQRVRLASAAASIDPQDSAALKSYALYDYLTAARLRRALDGQTGEALDVTIDGFLQAHARQPVARTLRHDWLESLALRHRWEWFLPRSADMVDPVLLCDRLEGRLETGDTRALGADVLVRWNLPQRQPHECDGVFTWLRQQGLASPALAAVRTRAALAADKPRLAREFAVDLDPASASPLLQWARLLETPWPELSALASSPGTAVDPDALDAGFNRLARTDSSAAMTLLPRLLARPDMTPQLQGRLQRDAALGAAYERSPAAVAALERVPAEASDDEVWQWRVRAALWAGDYERALAWLGQMPPALAALPRWQYWRARAVAVVQGNDTAAPLFAGLAGMRDYYGYLAADRLQRAYSLNAEPSSDDAMAQAALASQPGMLRAHELFECNMTEEAIAEWGNEISDAAPAVKVQAARVAASWGWYHESIATLAQAGDWNDVRLRYPRPYAAAIGRASTLARVPGDWLLAVMRQESLFRPDANSRAGARGLMQIRPSTAAALARRWQLPVPSPESLFDPETAITLGAVYLRELLDRYDGQLGPALAAYNAGPLPVARWLPARPMDADIWIENIAYGETRDYLQRIFEHIIAFAWVRDAEPPRLVSLLPPVEPATGAEHTASLASVGSRETGGTGRSMRPAPHGNSL